MWIVTFARETSRMFININKKNYAHQGTLGTSLSLRTETIERD